MVQYKKCSRCKKKKSTLKFGKNKRFKDGLHYNCKPCALQQGKESKYIVRYGITLGQKMEILKLQNGLCAICSNDITLRSCVDHNHKTGQVRALLCDQCNTGIGMFKENINLLNGVIEYLNKHRFNLTLSQ